MKDFAPLIDRIYDNAKTVLAQKGLEIENADVREKIADIPGITVRGDRAFFTPDHTDGFLTRYQEKTELHEATAFTTGCLSHAAYLYDFNDEFRPLTEADNNDMARLIDALRDKNIFGSAPGIPQDVPAPLMGISQFVSSAKNSRSAPSWGGYKSLGNELLIKEANEVMGLEYYIGVHLLSPMKLTGNEVEIGLTLHERFPHLPVAIGSMPTVGLTTPATIVSGFTVAVAEILAGGMVFEALGTSSLSLSVNLYPFDMRYMSFIYGTPANIVINRLEIEINRRIFKTQIVSKALRTMSQRPDAQASVQKAAYAGIMAEYGKRNFIGAGSLSMDEAFSPVQLLFDAEIMSELRKVYEMNETVFDEEHLLLDVILENEDGDFITADSTLDFFRENQWDSKLFPSYQARQWIQAGKPEVYAAAKEQAKKLIAQNSFELEPEKARALDSLYAWAKENTDKIKD